MIKALIGAGGFAREIEVDLFSLIKFVDSEYLNIKDCLISPLSELNPDRFHVIIAIGDSQRRYKKFLTLSKDIKFFTFISKKANVLDKDTIEIGEGSAICAGAILTTNIKLGKHSQINLNSTIGHDCKIGEFFTCAPGVHISGNCTIGDRVYIGTNSSIKQGVRICNDVIIGMQSCVLTDINEPGTYVGCPAKKL